MIVQEVGSNNRISELDLDTVLLIFVVVIIK